MDSGKPIDCSLLSVNESLVREKPSAIRWVDGYGIIVSAKEEDFLKELGDDLFARWLGDQRANDHGSGSDEPHDGSGGDSAEDEEFASEAGHGKEGDPAAEDGDDTGVGADLGSAFPIECGEDERGQGGKTREAPDGE